MRKLGFAGAPMTDGLLRRLTEAFRPELFVNHYGSIARSIPARSTRTPPPSRASAGKPGLNQRIRVVKLGGGRCRRPAAPGEEGEIVASLLGDEAFEGYWRRPDADAKALRDGWYFTGDTGYFDADGELFVTGRVDDMIITGGENVSPVEVESCLSLHPAVAEVAVVGLPDERLGKIVTAFVTAAPRWRRRIWTGTAASPAWPTSSARGASCSSTTIPKSPVGKLLRRKLVSGEYEPAEPQQREPPMNDMSGGLEDPRRTGLDGFRVEVDAARSRGDIDTGPAALQRHLHAAARPVAPGVRGAGRG